MRLPVLWIPFQIHRFIKGYTVIFRFISVPFHFKVDSFILNHLITSSMEYIALCASFFLKNALISERKSVTLCKGIGLSNVLICNYKITHFLRYAEIPVPLLYPKKKVIY